jgi:hypothetical protein
MPNNSAKSSKKQKSASKASEAAAAAVAAVADRRQKESKKSDGSSKGSSKKSSSSKSGGGSESAKKKRKKAQEKLAAVPTQSEDEAEEEEGEEVEQFDSDKDDEDESDESSEASGSESENDEEEEAEVLPKSRNKKKSSTTTTRTPGDSPVFESNNYDASDTEDPFDANNYSMTNLWGQSEEAERRFKDRSESLVVTQVTPGSVVQEDFDWVHADLVKPHKDLEVCLDLIKNGPARNVLSREDCAKFVQLEWSVARMERQNIELKRKCLEIEASWELLKTSKKAKKGQLSQSQAQMVSEANGAIHSTVLRLVKWPKPGWTNYSTKPNSICQLMIGKISLPPGLEEEQKEVLGNEVIAPVLPRMMTQARNGILQPTRT